MSATTTQLPFTIAGFPLRSWAFAVRIWMASVVALLASFWLQLEAPASAMLTVMILAEPTRGQALEKAGFRLIATLVGVVASIAIVGSLSQTRDLLLVAFALWMGLCIYACGLLDGYRAYAAVLSGYTVAFIAIQQIDNPQGVFEAATERGAAIAVGVLSITLVNDLLLAPDRHPQLGAQLAALHQRVRNYARAVIRREATDAVAVAALIREIVTHRPDISSLAAESSSGPVRSAAARSAMVALVAELQAARALAALPAKSDTALRERWASAFDLSSEEFSKISSRDQDAGSLDADQVPLQWALGELMRRDSEVRVHLAALKSVVRPSRSWRAPLYRSQRIAIENGVRAAACVAAACLFFVLAGWPSASSALSLVAVAMGLGATTPAPRTFTTLGFFGAPIAVALTGILEFFVLNGVSDFPLLALGLAPFLIGAALMATSPNPVWAGLGKVNLIFISAIFAPSNPQTYNPQSFLFTSLFTCAAMSVLLATQYLIPPVSDRQRRRWLLASARHDLRQLLDRPDRRYAPEEAAFRDAVRVGQIASAGPNEAEYRTSVEHALEYFDQAAAIRCGAARLTQLTDRAIGALVVNARAALAARDPQLIRVAANDLRAYAETDHAVAAARAALVVAGAIVEQAAAAAIHVQGARS
ncbi:FUSC family protein [Mesorhizobium neociceri]|uniref:FUSC family protein n=1 Tax=Mesorhizobium neociceri TaxID=1307853 RepID=A0A838BDT2_9HYPH|nr:FUSC family protein [Mesorhizobium neociceri]MBA1144413.1 FUSC family protein [Mesorhizobium neociceri]